MARPAPDARRGGRNHRRRLQRAQRAASSCRNSHTTKNGRMLTHPPVRTINKLRRTFKSIPMTCASESCFFHQCAHWWKKQYQKSVRRPEIREDFRRAKFFSPRIEKPSGFSMLRTGECSRILSFFCCLGTTAPNCFGCMQVIWSWPWPPAARPSCGARRGGRACRRCGPAAVPPPGGSPAACRRRST